MYKHGELLHHGSFLSTRVRALDNQNGRDINIKTGGEHKPRQNKGERGDVTVVMAI